MNRKYDVAIVGGGIVGLSHAWMAAKRGLSVALFERTHVAEGASVRNFGMIWPIGQTAGHDLEIALKSREFWLQLKADKVLEVEECGSIHLAHHQDELELLNEFCKTGTHGSEMLTREQVLARSAMANPKGLLGGMWSETELRVNPRVASTRIAKWLSDKLSVDLFFGTTIHSIDNHVLMSTTDESWIADQVIVCSGSDLQTLFPSVFSTSGLRLCKLQMLKTKISTGGLDAMKQSPAPHIASGLTLRHYSSFQNCDSYSAVKQRISGNTPELDQFGIHVMASHFQNGDVILGDSHEYGDQISPFDKVEIDELILRELRKVICLDDWNVIERWNGIYAKHPSLLVFEEEVDAGVRIFVGPGGAGMTLSFGLADRAWKQWN
jgi:FAD dependent oxidoreductase TIGR03364